MLFLLGLKNKARSLKLNVGFSTYNTFNYSRLPLNAFSYFSSERFCFVENYTLYSFLLPEGNSNQIVLHMINKVPYFASLL